MIVRQLSRGVRTLLYYSGFAMAGLVIQKMSHNCTILLYHGVSSTSEKGNYFGGAAFIPRDTFERQICYLKANFHILSLRDVITKLESGTELPCGSVVITFDDGYRDNFTCAYPILKRLDIPFTVFITTNFINNQKVPWWLRLEDFLDSYRGKLVVSGDSAERTYDLSGLIERYRLYRHARSAILSMTLEEREDFLEHLETKAGVTRNLENRRFMSWEEVRLLAADPLVEIGSHTISHPVVANLCNGELHDEIAGSKQFIENKLGLPIVSFSYPYGQRTHYSQDTIAELRESGYSCAVTGVEAINGSGANLYEMHRIWIERDDTWPIFISKIVGLGAFVRSVRTRFSVPLFRK